MDIINRYILYVLLVLFFPSTQAADISPLNIPAQQDQQKVCAQQLAARCTDKCKKSKDIANFAQLCQINAQNECRYAGE